MERFLSNWCEVDSPDALTACLNNMAITTIFIAVTIYVALLPRRSAEGFTWFSRPTSGSTASPVSEKEDKRGIQTWWNDLAPPFALTDDNEVEDEMEHEDESMEDTSDDDSSSENRPTVTHFFFLVHGHRGFSRDLSYLQHKMESVATSIRKKRKRQRKASVKESADNLSADSEPFHQLVVHSAQCNERKTDDGIVNGGDRLVEEMLSTIREKMEKRTTPNNFGTGTPSKLKYITISMLGNSLGGIYSRYAIARLLERCGRGGKTSSDFVLDEKFQVSLNIFCTTATPHLGIAGHTFFAIPRSAEIGVAHAMGDTGRDLFRLNDLMKRMATSEEYLGPLKLFRKRIAYANAYSTDFPVPVRTAAFLSETSSYPHHFVGESEDGDDRVVIDDNGLVIATFQTPPNHLAEADCYVGEKASCDLEEMSRSLDSLGWRKVFVDVRKEIPTLMKVPSVPKISLTASLLGRNTELVNSGDPLGETVDTQTEKAHKMSVDRVDALKQKGAVVESRDVAAALSTHPLFGEETIRWPRGHNMIVAFSRNPISTYLNKAGRPVVNTLAQELVDSALSWKPDEFIQ